jgi:hypothetical protein
MGLFVNYDAKKTLQNQEKKAVNMSLEFTPDHEKSYKELSTSVAVALPEMKGQFCPPLCSQDQVFARL